LKLGRLWLKSRKSSHTETAGGTPTSGSGKNLFAKARARRLLCIPVKNIGKTTINCMKHPDVTGNYVHLSQKI
jgi:hypothetical protein